jgi:methylase of polypeptide subunit release factors
MRKWIKLENFDLICMNLLQAFNPSKFTPEVIFFNPPYVRTSDEELAIESVLDQSWAGGNNGITVISEFLEFLTRFSFKEAFFLSSNLNQNEVFESQFSPLLKFDMIAEKGVENERLLCYKVQRLP